MIRPPVHVNLRLPELTPQQATSLWSFLEALAAQLWDAYEADILELEDSLSTEAHDDPTADEYEAYLDRRSALTEPVTDPESDTEF